MQSFKKMTDQELIETFNDAYASVYIDEVYGTKDMLFMEGAQRELERRGYEIIEQPRLPEITKVTEDE